MNESSRFDEPAQGISLIRLFIPLFIFVGEFVFVFSLVYLSICLFDCSFVCLFVCLFSSELSDDRSMRASVCFVCLWRLRSARISLPTAAKIANVDAKDEPLHDRQHAEAYPQPCVAAQIRHKLDKLKDGRRDNIISKGSIVQNAHISATKTVKD